MKKVLVTGLAGALGAYVLAGLKREGYWVRALILPGQGASLAGVQELWEGNLCDPRSLCGIAEGMDCVIHMAGVILSSKPELFAQVNGDGTRHLLRECIQQGVGHFIYVSSISVIYGESNAYARSKAAAESCVSSAEISWTIVRPTLLVGEAGGAEFKLFARLAQFPLVFLPHRGRTCKRPVHGEDLAQGLVALLAAREKVLGQIYALAGRDILSLSDMLAAIARERGRPAPWILPLPTTIARLFARFWDRRVGKILSAEQVLGGLLQDAAPSLEAAERDIGYAPRSLDGRWLQRS